MSLIKNWIKKNQQKSNSEKNRIALILAFILTVIIVGISILVKPLLKIDNQTEITSEVISSGPFSIFGDILNIVKGKE